MQVKEDCIIALNDDTRIYWASHETFTTGFEGKYGMRQIGRKEEIPHGKRKHPDPAGQFSAKPFDANSLEYLSISVKFSGRKLVRSTSAF